MIRRHAEADFSQITERSCRRRLHRSRFDAIARRKTKMKHDTRQTISAAFLLVVVLLTATAAGATYDPGAIDPPEDERVLSILADTAQRATEPSWTPQRRSSAQPPAVGEVTSESLAGAMVTRQEPLPTGAPGFVPGSPPQPGADAAARMDFP